MLLTTLLRQSFATMTPAEQDGTSTRMYPAKVVHIAEDGSCFFSVAASAEGVRDSTFFVWEDVPLMAGLSGALVLPERLKDHLFVLGDRVMFDVVTNSEGDVTLFSVHLVKPEAAQGEDDAEVCVTRQRIAAMNHPLLSIDELVPIAQAWARYVSSWDGHGKAGRPALNPLSDTAAVGKRYALFFADCFPNGLMNGYTMPQILNLDASEIRAPQPPNDEHGNPVEPGLKDKAIARFAAIQPLLSNWLKTGRKTAASEGTTVTPTPPKETPPKETPPKPKKPRGIKRGDKNKPKVKSKAETKDETL